MPKSGLMNLPGLALMGENSHHKIEHTQYLQKHQKFREQALDIVDMMDRFQCGAHTISTETPDISRTST